MARRPTSGPDWFDVANYDSMKDATLRDWLVELTNRKSCFAVLRAARAKERYLGHESLAAALDTWDRIRKSGSLTGEHRNTLSEIREKFGGHPLFDEYFLKPQQAEHERWIAEQREALGEGAVRPLTKGDVVLRFFVAGEMNSLANEENGVPIEVDSTVPMDAIGVMRSENVGFVRVDLYAPDSMIRADFDAWLAAQRQAQATKGGIAPRTAYPADLSDWHKFQILPYLDLTFAMEHEGFKLSQEQIGTLLFPDELDVSLAERVRKVTKPRAVAVSAFSFLEGLHRQYVNSVSKRID